MARSGFSTSRSSNPARCATRLAAACTALGGARAPRPQCQHGGHHREGVAPPRRRRAPRAAILYGTGASVPAMHARPRPRPQPAARSRPLRQQPRCAALDCAARRAAVRRAPHGQEEAAARVPVHRGGGVGASDGARLGQSCAGDARDAAARGSQACSWPHMCGTRCVPAAVPRQNPPSAICYRARALAQRWCATPGLSATRRALEAWACLVVPVLTSAAIGAVVTRHNCCLSRVHPYDPSTRAAL